MEFPTTHLGKSYQFHVNLNLTSVCLHSNSRAPVSVIILAMTTKHRPCQPKTYCRRLLPKLQLGWREDPGLDF